MTVKESTEYDNFLKDSRSQAVSLAKFIGNSPNTFDRTKAKKKSENIYKAIYVHFRNREDMADFCRKINQMILPSMKVIFYPAVDKKKALPLNFEEKVIIDPKLLKRTDNVEPIKPIVELDTPVYDEKWKLHWKEMPSFEQESKNAFRTITMKFRTEKDFQDFAKRIGQSLSDKTKTIWHPKLYVTANRKYRWIEEGSHTLPKYPMYIVSKTRYESMGTSKSLNRMRIPHYIVIEPQEEKQYQNAVKEFGLDMVTLLVAPFSNHGDGPGRARNWAWDHSISIGAKSHWVLDDNISDFYRLHRNIRIRFESGAGFRAMEDFVDRYENIPVAGPQYRFFIAPDQKYPAFVTNTRIYSTLLIRNDCKHRWRGRYNEDTDLCLRVLKGGECTVQFNAFLQGKAATQTVAGGNTSEFYHVEGNLDKGTWRDGHLNSEGTINKSQMLVDMHPDVASLVFRYGRWHHFVDYTSFKKNKLKLKEGIVLKDEPNEYNMRLIDNYGE